MDRSTLCSSDEVPMFSCDARGKTFSLCRSGSLSEANVYVQYRAGTPKHLELEFPAEKPGSLKRFGYYSDSSPKSTLIEVTFHSGSYEYVLYAETDAYATTSSATGSGVAVFRGGTKLADYLCDQQLRENLFWLQDNIGIPIVKGFHEGLGIVGQ